MPLYQTQAAYRGGRNTTEQVFALKIMAEKTITSSNFSAKLLMMDMSKAFNSIHRSVMMEDLISILILIKIIIQDISLAVKVGPDIRQTIHHKYQYTTRGLSKPHSLHSISVKCSERDERIPTNKTGA